MSVFFLLITGCGGDGGVGIASGQQPDPVAVDFPVTYTKRSLPTDDNGAVITQQLTELDVFAPGAQLWVRDRAAASAPERKVAPAEDSDLYDIRDLNVDYDGSRVVFAMRGPFDENLDEDEQPTWNIWEYEFATATLRRIIESDLVAGSGHDRMPAFLPDGRIVFSSTRQRRTAALLLDEGRPQYKAQIENGEDDVFVLHVMQADGSQIGQVSFNTSHDLYPSVLDDGTVVFSRWENTLGRNGIALYRLRPDGAGLELLYGANSHATGTDGSTVQFSRVTTLPSGQLLAWVTPFDVPDFGGNLVVVDSEQFVEVQQGLMTTNAPPPAQQAATVNDVRTDDQPSPGGRFQWGTPVWDGSGRLLVTWSDCRLIEDENIVPCTADRLAAAPTAADPLYGLWLYDPADQTQVPIVAPAEGIMVGEALAARPRPRPPALFDGTAAGYDPVLASEGVGVIDIRSVYDIRGVDSSGPGIATLADPALTVAAQRPARFLRLTRVVPLPDRDTKRLPGTAFGRTRFFGMREILGYVPVEPDGSVRTKVPADMAFTIEILDARGRRFSPRHRNWLQVRPGETLSCNGCHERDTGLSHGRNETFAAAWSGATDTGLPFANTRAELFADFGETMAQTRTRISCATDCAAMTPSIDVVYEDVWTDRDAAGRDPDDAFAYRYSALQTDAPVAPACATAWDATCRIVINYEQHIHSLWSVDRRIFDDDEVTVLEDRTCTACHNPRDAMDQLQVPAGQLDLSGGASPDQADHLTAYRELLFNDNEQEIVDGALVDRLVEVGIDPDTLEPIFDAVNVAPSMVAGRALSSGRFLDRFYAAGTHEGFLTEAELKLLIEWLDVGAQYYNDPFAVPDD